MFTPTVAQIPCEIQVPLFALLSFVLGLCVGIVYARAKRPAPARPAGKPAPARQPRSGMPAREAEARQRRAPAPSGSSASGGSTVELYVGNLPYEVDDDELNKTFAAHGKVAEARVITNRFNGKSKGYGFVEMADQTGAQAAISALNGKEIKGRKIVVNEAKS